MPRILLSLFRASLLCVVLSGCTLGKKESVPLPAVLESHFRACQPLNGAMVLQVFLSGALQGSVELDWASDDGGWKADMTDAAGFSVLRLHQTGREVRTSGPARKRFPVVTVDADGFLRMNGHFVGIKAREVPCLLHSALPRAWTLSVIGHSKKSSNALIDIDDGDRDITVRLKNLGDASNEEVCADISWRNKLIFESQVRWCVRGPGLKRGELSGIGDYTVKWVQFDE